MELPKHVAIIMDGNGRWAEKRGLSRLEGHREGVKAVKASLESALKNRIPYLTIYAFSSENWSRPKIEVNGLMKLLNHFLKTEGSSLLKNKVRLRTIGRLEALPKDTQEMLESTTQKTKDLDTLTLTIALNYSAKNEIVDAFKAMIKENEKKEIDLESMDYETIENYLYTRDLPNPDLIIRTSGEFRLSNFLLLQSAYSEIYVTPVYWPDFTEADFKRAIQHYLKRERRFGNVQ
tara:strand:- start:69 stop:770 length:702 start_codon:yes stop_codon:yes gene_type:complete